MRFKIPSIISDMIMPALDILAIHISVHFYFESCSITGLYKVLVAVSSIVLISHNMYIGFLRVLKNFPFSNFIKCHPVPVILRNNNAGGAREGRRLWDGTAIFPTEVCC